MTKQDHEHKEHFLMNPRISVGDRVTVKRTLDGYSNLHVGRTGTITALDYRLTRNPFSGYGYSSFASRETVYIVQMDEPRPEQVRALIVEKIPPLDAAVGDRVRIKKAGRFGMAHVLDGLFGVVESAAPTNYRVRLDGKPAGVLQTVTVEQVEKVQPVEKYHAPTAAVGDYVVVLRSEMPEHVGQLGTVTEIKEPFQIGGETFSRVYGVTVKGVGAVGATKVAKAPEPEPATAGAVKPVDQGDAAADLSAILIDARRAQAAQFAHTLLGDGDLDDLIRLAEFVEGTTKDEPAEPLADWEKELLTAGSLDAAKKATDKTLSLGGGVAVSRDDSPDSDVVEIDGSYISIDDIDALIQYLGNAKRVHLAR